LSSTRKVVDVSTPAADRDLDKAPRNSRGMVEFSSPFQILKPENMGRGNHKLFYGINNRGNRIELTMRGFPERKSRKLPGATSPCQPASTIA
jgi:hypothetical protein